MAICEVCGNDYDKAFQVVRNGEQHTFDSFECAINAMAPTCATAAAGSSAMASRRTARSIAAQAAPAGRRRGARRPGLSASAGSGLGQPLRLLAELAAVWPRRGGRKASSSPCPSRRSGSRHAAVDQEGANRLRRLRAEHLARCSSARIPVRRVHDRDASQVGGTGLGPGCRDRVAGARGRSISSSPASSPTSAA